MSSVSIHVYVTNFNIKLYTPFESLLDTLNIKFLKVDFDKFVTHACG